jgi:hypothetical protein
MRTCPGRASRTCCSGNAINVLREHRGDGHIAALLAAGMDPCEALVSFAAIGAAPEEVFASRG